MSFNDGISWKLVVNKKVFKPCRNLNLIVDLAGFKRKFLIWTHSLGIKT